MYVLFSKFPIYFSGSGYILVVPTEKSTSKMATMAETDSIERGFRRLSSIFHPPVLDAHKCYRCKDTVYHAEKMGPVLEVMYHKHCFKCVVCDQHLTMKNYFTSQIDQNDRELYCSNHYPRVGAAKYGQSAIGIRGPVKAQENFRKMSKKLDGQVRKPGTVRIPTYDAQAIAIKRILTSPKAQEYTAAVNAQAQKVSLPPDAMGIKQPLAAQRLSKTSQQNHAGHMYQPKVIIINNNGKYYLIQNCTHTNTKPL